MLFWSRLTLVQKLVVYLVGLSVLPLLVVGGTAYWTASNALTDQARQYSQTIQNKQAEILALQLKQVEALTAQIAGLETVTEALTAPLPAQDSYAQLATNAQIGYILNRHLNVDGLQSIDLVGTNGAYHHVGDTLQTGDVDTGLRDKLFQEALEREQALYWPGIEANINGSSTAKRVVPAVRVLRRVNRETLKFEPIGMVIANFSVDHLYDTLIQLNATRSGYLMIADQKGRMIYHPDRAQIGQPYAMPIALDKLDGAPRHSTVDLDGQSLELNHIRTPRTGWHLLSVVPAADIRAKTATIGVVTLSVLAASLLLVALTGRLVSRSVAQPIQEVIGGFKRYESGELDLDRPLDVTGRDEIAQLRTWFNAFLATLQTRLAFERALKQAKDDAERANRFKSEFLSNMSHELRTPLNAISGFSEVMLMELHGPVGSPRYAGYLRDIKHSAEHLQTIVNDILDLSKIETGKWALEESWFDPSEEIQACQRLMRQQIASKAIALTIELPAELPALYADATALRRVLLNLLSNAVKFTREDGRITVAATRLPAAAGGGLRIDITDDGIGIPQDHLKTVMEPFGQVHAATVRNQEGTGLGLAIVRSLMEQHGGSAEIDSVLGAWTRVTLTFPEHRLSSDRAQAQLPAPKAVAVGGSG